MKARLAFPTRGWAKISWHPDEHPPLVLSRRLEKLSEVPGVRWNHAVIEVPETAWMLPLFRGVLAELELEEDWETHAPRRPNEDRSSYAAGGGAVLDGSGGFWTPYPWQVEAAQKALDNGRALLLADDMGLGKTRSAIESEQWFRYYSALDDAWERPTLIVAPSFTVDVWRRELLATGVIKDESEFCALRSRDHNADVWRPGCKYYFVHFEVLGAWASHIAMVKPLVTVVDEIHWLKNGKAQRSKGAMMAAGRSYLRIGLTGTPLANRVGELWSVLSILTGKNTWGSPIEFRRRYAGAVRTEFGYQDRSPTNVEELQARLAPYYLRRTIDDIDHELPALTRQLITCQMGGKQRAQHDDAVSRAQMDELVNALVQGRAGVQALKVLMKLRKATSAAKVQTTIDHVAGLLEQGQSVVCFCWQKKTAATIARGVRTAAKRRGTSTGLMAVLTGDDAQSFRDDTVRDFQKCFGPALLSATYGVLKEGVTLTKARAVVLHDLDWVPSNILQAEKRVHRLGQNAACMSYWMVAEDSIDTILARLLIQKAEVIQKVLGIDAPAEAADELGLEALTDNYDPAQWAREQMDRWFK